MVKSRKSWEVQAWLEPAIFYDGLKATKVLGIDDGTNYGEITTVYVVTGDPGCSMKFYFAAIGTRCILLS